MPERELGVLIGAPDTSVRRLKRFTRWLIERAGGRFEHVRRAPLEALRRELLARAGLAQETADAILLHAAGRPVFVAGADVRRALVAEGFIRDGTGCDEARAFVEAHLPSDPALFAELHELLGELGTSLRHGAVGRHRGGRPAIRHRRQ